MKSAEIKNKAFTAFLDGASLRQIAAQPGMPSKRCLEKWSAAESWVIAREQARADARRKAICARVPILAGEYASLEAQKYQLGMKSIAQLVALVEGDLTEADLAISKSELIRLVARLTE